VCVSEVNNVEDILTVQGGNFCNFFGYILFL